MRQKKQRARHFTGLPRHSLRIVLVVTVLAGFGTVLILQSSAASTRLRKPSTAQLNRIKALASSKWGGICENGKDFKLHYKYNISLNLGEASLGGAKLPKTDPDYCAIPVNMPQQQKTYLSHLKLTRQISRNYAAYVKTGPEYDVYLPPSEYKKGLSMAQFWCDTIVHEAGHLAGIKFYGAAAYPGDSSHSSSKHNIMYKYSTYDLSVVSECRALR